MVKDINDVFELPLQLKISFEKLMNQYEELTKGEDKYLAEHAKRVLTIGKENPILIDGFSNPDLIHTYQKEIAFILKDSFSAILTNNEIKTATIPFHDLVFNSSSRFKKIISVVGNNFKPVMKDMPNDLRYIIGCLIILNRVYGYNANFSRPFLYEIPDANGIMRYYKILYNADFTDITPNKKAPKITQEDYELLIDSYDNLDIWKEKFPPQSYTMKGFVISNIFDVTDDYTVSQIKSTLIGDIEEHKDMEANEEFNDIFRSLLNVKDMKVGFSMYNAQEDRFEKPYGGAASSYLLNGKEEEKTTHSLCSKSHQAILKDREFYAVSDVDKWSEFSNGKAPQYNIMKEQGFKSFILAPIADENELLGVLELVSETPKVLNSVNASKLAVVIPSILSAVQRLKKEEQNLIAAIIQQECTSIHPSVQWRFTKEAKQFLRKRANMDNVSFNKISFENVYPLYGQMDIKGSSARRNQATKNDLNVQLKLAKAVINDALKERPLYVYEQIVYQIKEYLKEIETSFQVDTEQRINNFFHKKLTPLFQHFLQENIAAKSIEKYFSKIDQTLNMVYKYRKDYDDAVAHINKKMANFLDEKQLSAQQMYPHFFERYKTDGIEHNMYIGESISENKAFNKMYLYNLRIWQLQMMCEMENAFYCAKDELPVPLEVASMILVFNQQLSISFRTDEKHFDVDGTYNARYEIVKKRVDKALIKGTDERVTQAGKLSIIYSQKEDELEYLKYIRFLQSKHYLGSEVEIIELDDLQSVTGLKAIRVNILYQQKEQEDKLYTYKDLIKVLN